MTNENSAERATRHHNRSEYGYGANANRQLDQGRQRDAFRRLYLPNQMMRLLTALLLISICGANAFADQVLVAAASDLNFPIKEIITQFEQKTGHNVKLTLGSSGNF